MSGRTIEVRRLGRVPYAEALALQHDLQARRVAQEIGDVLLLLEHPPVITLGRAARDTRNVLLSPAALAARGFEVHEVGRGGDVTYHGPGQLVAYPIVSLEPDRKDVRRYVRDLEEAMIGVCADHGLTAGRSDGQIGCWIGERKIGAIGVRISRWVTMHGLALNVAPDLSHFEVIVPCGIADRGVTSLERETGRPVAMSDVEARLVHHLGAVLGARMV